MLRGASTPTPLGGSDSGSSVEPAASAVEGRPRPFVVVLFNYVRERTRPLPDTAPPAARLGAPAAAKPPQLMRTVSTYRCARTVRARAEPARRSGSPRQALLRALAQLYAEAVLSRQGPHVAKEVHFLCSLLMASPDRCANERVWR